MKPIYAKVLDGLQDEVFATRIINRPFFSTEFHFHTECQMTYVVKSSGQKIVGDCIESFDPDELTLLGSDIPHVWHNLDLPANTSANKKDHARSIALFFHPAKTTELLGHFYDVKRLEQVLQQAKRGMKFYGKAKGRLKELLYEMADAEGVNKFLLLVQVLQILSTTREYKLLASAGYVNTYQTRDNERINRVFKHLFSNFSGEVKLDEVAAIANMNKQAFCRFFKARTQKTLVQFINEIRIAHAIKLMSQDDVNIGTIVYECGYNSISNFNKFFKLMTNKTPTEFKKQHLPAYPGLARKEH